MSTDSSAEAPAETPELTDSELEPSDEVIDAKIRETFAKDDEEAEEQFEGEEEQEAEEGDSLESEDDPDTELTEAGDDEPTDGDEEEEPTEDDEPDPEPDLDSKTLNIAKMMGIPADDAAELAKQGEFGKRVLEKISAAGSRTSRAFSMVGRQKEQIAQLEAKLAETPGDEKAGPDAAKEPGDAPEIPEFTEEEWGESATQLNAIASQARKASELEGKVARLEEHFAQQEERAAAEEVTKFFGNLDAKLYPEFGTGDVAMDTPEYEQRGEVVTKAVELLAGAEFAGHDLDYTTALQQALLLVKPDAHKKADRRTLSKKVAARKKQMTARPTARRRTKTKKSGEEDVREALHAMAQNRPGIAEFLKGAKP